LGQVIEINGKMSTLIPARDTTANQTLYAFHGYRMILATVLIVIGLTAGDALGLGQADPMLYQSVSGIYLCLVVFSMLCLVREIGSISNQIGGALVVDILTISLLVHASGGASSGLGILLLVSLSGGSLLLDRRNALAMAALSSIALLSEQLYTQLHTLESQVNYTYSGLLGVAFFAVTMLAQLAGTRLRVVEAVAVRQQSELSSLEQLNEHIIDRMESGVLAVDHDDQLLLGNSSAWQLLQCPVQQEGTSLERLSNKLNEELEIWRATSRSDPVIVEHGDKRLICRFQRIGDHKQSTVLVFLDDNYLVTQHAQQLKLASLGHLSATIAHEIRNPLGAISHAAQLLAESKDVVPNDRRLTEIITNHCQRLDEIVDRILSMSRDQTPAPQPLNLDAWLNMFCDQVSDAGDTALPRPSIKTESGLTAINFDPTHLYRILENLCSNANHHGTAYQRPLSVKVHAHQGADNQIVLDVIDTGVLIADEIAEKMFEPFFTTGTHGTGLGLYISRELCRTNGAELIYTNTGGNGNCFRIVARAA
jgi:two-component system sensor histidine kinase PilS (NtrC family)